ncbi:PVC-type heme-binding CxxCH protein [Pontibacter russatus]|uniref:PVC-type heme-binding CxxCH protein n=1 Tax=Pontibacter russatus TaxID=2694929 RepID=UPI001F3B142F|nr:PVC-type heme-binding CxxCH protein [Pontibacter russatus]
MLVPVFLLVTSMVNQSSRTDTTDPKVALEAFHIAEGFEVTLFAAEPMVVKPIQMNWDTEGRLWVVSSTAYPHLKTGEEANDKITVLEDTDGDGKADKSTIFAEGLLTPTGILPGDGGVYVANSTEILHFRDTDGDGKADKKHQVLTGFGTGDTHHLIHTFRWGPAGRLYFNQSIYIYSHIETPTGVKRLEGGGVWQLNPETLELDIFAKGLINPWGLQFDRWGQTFLTDGAGNEGINYAFPGATFVTSPGAERIIRGLNPGQPKHSGLEVISGRHLPESWQGSVITNDFRANRINRFELEEQGSGYASKQAGDLLWTDDVAFRPVDISVGPDGAIYVADWYNPIIQHGEVDFHDPRRDQEHGRIWRIVAKDRPLVKTPKLETATTSELLDALKLPEEWTRSQARQVLKARGAGEVIPALQKWAGGLDKNEPDYEHHLLEALWVHQSLGVVNEQLLLSLLDAKSHNARAAGLRALQFWHDKVADVPGLLARAVKDEHPQVRLEAVIALRSEQTAEAARTALAVLEHPMDEFLDYALWQTMRELEPVLMKRLKKNPDFFGDPMKTAFALKSMHSPEAVTQLVGLYQKDQVPEAYQKDVLNSIARWGTTADLNTLFDMAVQGYAGQSKNVAAQLGALAEAARQRETKPDKGLSRIAGFTGSKDEATVIHALRLIGYWDMEEMSGQLISLTQKKDKNIRKAALGALAALDSGKAEKALTGMASGKNDMELRLLATAQLASLNVDEAARLGVGLLQRLPAQEDASELFRAFLSQKQGARVFGEELMSRKIPADVAKAVRPGFERQIPWGRQKDEDVTLLRQALEASGGILPAERMPQQLSSREINSLAIEINGKADHDLGEAVFRKSNCASCHAIGGAGGLIGPDLSSLGTSSPVETIIHSILYPSQSIKEGYELQRVVKKDGSELMGYLVSNGATEIVMRDVAGREVSVAKSQIEVLEKVTGSLMPPGLTAGLEKEEFINLVGFLSQLGESGKFRVPNTQFVRRWQTVPGNKELSEKINKDGLGHIVKAGTRLPLQPAYSKVAGDLPVGELPVVEVNAKKRYSFVRFDTEVLSEGNVDFAFNSTAGITAWVDRKPLKLEDNGVVVNLSQGIHQITLAIDRSVYPNGPLSIQLQEAKNSPAQTRLVMGQ